MSSVIIPELHAVIFDTSVFVILNVKFDNY